MSKPNRDSNKDLLQIERIVLQTLGKLRVLWQKIRVATSPASRTTTSPSLFAQPAKVHSARVNYRGVVRLLAVVVVVGLCVHLLHTLQVRRLADELLKQATRAESADKPLDAIEHLRCYVAHAPQDIDARARLVLLLDQHATKPTEVTQSVLALEDVLRRDSQQAAVRQRVAERLLQLRRWGHALRHLQDLQKQQPEDPGITFLLGRCYEGKDEPKQAAAAYRQVVDRQADAWNAYQRLLNLLRGDLEQPSAADELADKMVDRNKTSPEAYVRRARDRLLRGEPQAAHQDLDRADILQPDYLEATLTRAAVVLSDPKSSPEDLNRTFDRLARELERRPRELRLYLSLFEVALRTQSLDRAIVVLERGQETFPQHIGIGWRLAELWIIQGQSVLAHGQIQRLNRLQAPRAILQYLRGRKLLSENRLVPARRLLRNVQRDLHVSDRLRFTAGMQLAECCGRLGLFDEQLQAYDSTLALDPSSLPARLGRATTLSRLGRLDIALEVYRPLLASPQIQLRYARVWLQRTYRLPAAQRDWRRIMDFLTTIKPGESLALEHSLLRTVVLHAQGQAEQARGLAGRIASEHPEEISAHLTQARLALASKDWTRAADLMERIAEGFGDSVKLRLIWAEYWMRRGGAQAGASLEQLSEDGSTFSEPDQATLWYGLASAHRGLGQLSKTLELLQEVCRLRKNYVPVQFEVATLAAQLDQPDVSDRALESLRNLVGSESPHVRVVEVLRLCSRTDRELSAKERREARATLTEVTSRQTTWGIPYLLLARLDQWEHDFDGAAANYKRAIELGIRDLNVLREAMSLLAITGKLNQARQLIRQFQDDVPALLRPAVQQFASVVAFRAGNFELALSDAQQALEADPWDWRNCLWVGILQAGLGERELAQDAFEAGVKVAPNVPGPWVVLVSYFVRTSQKSAAARAVDRATQALSPVEHALSLAVCHEMIGQTQDAERCFQAFIAERPNDPQALAQTAAFYLRNLQNTKAQPLLNRMITNPGTTSSRTRWARRKLAAIYSRRDYPHFLRALKLLDANIAEMPDETADRRLKAQWLASQPIVKHRREAIQILERLAEVSRLSASDQQLLVSLYEADGRQQKANAKWTALIQDHPNDPVIVTAYVGRLLTKADLQSAADWLNRLQKLAPDRSATVELAAWANVLKGQPEAAVDGLQRWVQSAEQPATSQERQAHAAQVLAQLWGTPSLKPPQRTILDHAVQRWYRQQLEDDPQLALPLSRFLARSGRVDEALDLCEWALQRLPTFQVTPIATSMVLSVKTTPDQLKRVHSWLVEGLRGRKSVVDALHLADLLMALEQYDKAESLYRSVLAARPQNIIALNNLALLLTCLRERHDEARKYIDSAIAAAGPVGELLDTRATVKLNCGEVQGAIRDMINALQLSDSPHRRLHLARAHLMAGNQDAAAKQLRLAEQGGLAQLRLNRFDRELHGYLRAQVGNSRAELTAKQQ